MRNAQAEKAASDKQASAKKIPSVLKAPPVKQVKVGDAVSLKTFPDQTGEVISVGSNANDYFRVKLGLLTVKAKVSDVIAVNATKNKARTIKQQAPMPAKSPQKSSKARKNTPQQNKNKSPPARGKEDSGGDSFDLTKLNRRL